MDAKSATATANLCQSINCDKKLVFHHIPKCGGSSLRETLRMALVCGGYHPNCVYVAGSGRTNLMSENELLSVKAQVDNSVAILSHIDAGLIKQISPGKIITCIRHPITRAISAFNHFTLMKESECEDLVTLFKQNKGKFNSLFGCLYSRRGAYGLGACNYEYVLIYERLQEDVPKMLAKLGLPNIPLPHIDPSPLASRNHKSRFCFDQSNSDHQEIWKYLETKLEPDIQIYNQYLKAAESASSLATCKSSRGHQSM